MQDRASCSRLSDADQSPRDSDVFETSALYAMLAPREGLQSMGLVRLHFHPHLAQLSIHHY